VQLVTIYEEAGRDPASEFVKGLLADAVVRMGAEGVLAKRDGVFGRKTWKK